MIALGKKSRFLIVALLVMFALFGVQTAQTATAGNLTFQWQANPPEENVIAYRLYYGPQSRYESDGSLKMDFAYPQFIDFMYQVRCYGTDYSYCEALGPEDVQCEDLYSETPKCTLYGLSGTLYFTMTACTNSAESGFTAELESATPEQLQNILHIIDVLLLSDSN